MKIALRSYYFIDDVGVVSPDINTKPSDCIT